MRMRGMQARDSPFPPDPASISFSNRLDLTWETNKVENEWEKEKRKMFSARYQDTKLQMNWISLSTLFSSLFHFLLFHVFCGEKETFE